MGTLFHLIRHGAYDMLDHGFGGRDPYSLSDEGRAQAERVAVRLAGRLVAALVSSPVQRARETAEPIGQRFGLPVLSNAAFAEVDFAGWTGKRFDDLHSDPAWRAWNMFRGTAGIPGGETMLGVQARAIAGILALAEAHPDREVVVVSHADVIKAILANMLGIPLDLMRRMEIGPGSASLLELFHDDAKVLAMNVLP